MSKPPEEISAYIAGGAAVVSVLALIVNIIVARNSANASHRANKAAERNNEIFIGQVENELRTAISSARNRYEDVCASLDDMVAGRRPDQLNAEERRSALSIRRRQQSALENLLNEYENACSKYIDNKIDRDRFKKSFFGELRTLFADHESSFGKLLHPEGTSHFKALWKVYREWYDLEN